MKIVLQQVEFEKMAAAWVYENLVEKTMASATIVGDSVELEVLGEGDKSEVIEQIEPSEDLDDFLTSED